MCTNGRPQKLCDIKKKQLEEHFVTNQIKRQQVSNIRSTPSVKIQRSTKLWNNLGIMFLSIKL